jgi:NAD(P)-dependent dehydrogenase (short-subunit alcohol dehydrogenase family)
MGARLILVARNEERLQETLCMLSGAGHSYRSLDLTHFDVFPELVSNIVTNNGKIDGILHCAGISTTLPLKLMTINKVEAFFRINVFSAIELTREICKPQNMNRGASIVFFSSIMGCVGERGKSLYGMTKGALIAATRSLACEFAKREIRINAVSPGAIITPINEHLPHMSDPELRKKLENDHLLGLGQTTDISNACIYLLSEASRWVTGQNLIIDGGYTAR